MKTLILLTVITLVVQATSPNLTNVLACVWAGLTVITTAVLIQHVLKTVVRIVRHGN